MRLPWRLALAAATARCADSLHPRPEYNQYASYARWLVHESDYAVISTHHSGADVFGNIMSISDGEGYEHSTGVIYTYLPDLDATYQDVMANSNVALTFTEMALAGGSSGGCAHSTAENPPCGRLVVSGQLTRVPEDQEATALKYLYARHPEMEGWAKEHNFVPFWMNPESITSFFLINFYGGAVHPTVQDYLAAPWYRNATTHGLECGVCGHAYDAQRDGGGKAFEDLPDDWACPVCGSPKSAYVKVGKHWVHQEADMV